MKHESLAIALSILAVTCLLVTSTCRASEAMERKLIDDIVSGNAEGVAAVIEYPLDLGYPLAAITNKAQFVQVFPVIFDKALRAKIAASRKVDKWETVGCQGRMYADGMLWNDGLEANQISQLNYQSESLYGKWLHALAAEVKTLPRQYQRGVTGTISFCTENGQWWGRLDHGPADPKATPDERKEYRHRLMLYKTKPVAGQEPAAVHFCKAETEGQGTGNGPRYVTKDERFGLSENGIGTEDTPPCWITVEGKDLRGKFVRWPCTSAPRHDNAFRSP